MIRNSLFFFVLPLLCVCELITVETSRGSVQGFDHDFGSDKSQRFFGYGQMFLGIPYAKAPLEERRFTLPEDICQYNDSGEVHNATYYRPRCWQTRDDLNPATEMDEDCLYLNVMTPNVSGKYPLLVFIHGGTFTTGGADIYHWKGAVRNLVSRGVVVVTIQYRLGLLGFFTTFTEQFPPNRGLYDQLIALRWVKEEIAGFGGDSDRITIYGQSAGGASVSDLSLSPLARDLFHQLIQTSGSTTQIIETIDDPRGSIHQDRAKQICQIDSTDWGSAEKDQVLLDCLLNAKPQDLIEFDYSDFKHWNAAIDGALIPDYPENLAGSRPKYPTLIGDMLEDYAFKIPGVQDGDLSNINNQTTLQRLQYQWPNYDDETAKNMSQMMIDGYSNGEVPDDDDHLGWTQLNTQIFTGLLFDSNMIRDVQWHQKAGNEDLWLFTFAHRSLLPFGVEIDGWIPVAHCAELPYLWFYPDIWETYNASDSDLAAADYLGALWAEFTTTGKISLPRAGEAMNYIEIGEELTLRRNWRSIANVVYNEFDKQFPAYLGEFPPLTISEESWTKLNEVGSKIVTKWNSAAKCVAASTEPTTTKGESSISLIPYIILVVLLRFYV